jgi:hypothetical protein
MKRLLRADSPMSCNVLGLCESPGCDVGVGQAGSVRPEVRLDAVPAASTTDSAAEEEATPLEPDGTTAIAWGEEWSCIMLRW